MFRYSLKTWSPITVILERASFIGCESSRSHTLEKSRSKEERPAQAIFRQMQTDRQTISLVNIAYERKGRGDVKRKERFFQGGLPR